MPSQAGQRAIITGATGGLGFEAALALAQAGGAVVLAARDPAKGADALARLRAACPGADVHFARLDLASLASVRAFAQAEIDRGRPLDLLINNAGVMALPTRRVTEDGFEMQMGTNYLGHVALTAALLPALRAAPAPRVVSLSSLAHRGAHIKERDLQAAKRYTPWGAYGQSKLAMLMFCAHAGTPKCRTWVGDRQQCRTPRPGDHRPFHQRAGPPRNRQPADAACTAFFRPRRGQRCAPGVVCRDRPASGRGWRLLRAGGVVRNQGAARQSPRGLGGSRHRRGRTPVASSHCAHRRDLAGLRKARSSRRFYR